MKITFTAREIKEIALAAIVLSIAFALAYNGGILGISLGSFPVFVMFAFVAVGIGFLAHELIGHKVTAQRFGMHAEFKAWPFGLVFALLSSLAGFVFAAPGAVYVSSKLDLWGREAPITRRRMGIVSIMGPIINILLAMIFLGLDLMFPVAIGGISLFSVGVFVNVWLAIFNLLPIPPLDGSKVLAWDKRVWIAIFAISVALFIVLGFMNVVQI